MRKWFVLYLSDSSVRHSLICNLTNLGLIEHWALLHVKPDETRVVIVDTDTNYVREYRIEDGMIIFVKFS